MFFIGENVLFLLGIGYFVDPIDFSLTVSPHNGILNFRASLDCWLDVIYFLRLVFLYLFFLFDWRRSSSLLFRLFRLDTMRGQ